MLGDPVVSAVLVLLVLCCYHKGGYISTPSCTVSTLEVTVLAVGVLRELNSIKDLTLIEAKLYKAHLKWKPQVAAMTSSNHD